jgi:nucleoside-diphosphate-sugar epimerase
MIHGPVTYDYIYPMILVTGGTGLVGSHLLYELVKAGEPVRALKRDTSDTSMVKKVFSFYGAEAGALFPKIEWMTGDVTEPDTLLEALKDVDLVYHCAGYVSYNPNDAGPILKINAEGTANVVNACLEKKIRKLCHVSSVAALGDLPEGKLTDETWFWKGSARDNHYSIGKYNAEREVWRGTEEGLDAVIVNPSVIIGPGNWNASSCVVFRESHKGLRIYPRGGAGYVDVRDVVSVMIKLMNSGIRNERFILNAENSSFRDFANLVHDSLGKKRPSFPAGRFMLGLGWRLEKWRSLITGKPPVLTRVIARALNSTSVYSNEKVKQQLGFRFIPLSESVKYTAEIFLRDHQQ